MKILENNRLLSFAFVLMIALAGCTDDLYNYQETNYESIASTKAVITLKNKLSDGKFTSRVYATLYNITEFEEVKLIDSLKDATITFNNMEMVYGKIDGIKCFYPKNQNYLILPDSVYHITIKDITGTYDSYVKVPPTFQNLIVKDTVDLSKGIDLFWNNTNPSFRVYANVYVYNPSNPGERITMVDDYISFNDNIKVANSISPFVNGWFGYVELDRRQYGMCSLSMHKGSTILAKSSYQKQFVVFKK
jgi:hypothetical protein